MFAKPLIGCVRRFVQNSEKLIRVGNFRLFFLGKGLIILQSGTDTVIKQLHILFVKRLYVSVLPLDEKIVDLLLHRADGANKGTHRIIRCVAARLVMLCMVITDNSRVFITLRLIRCKRRRK